jgi:PAS domain S-box-containing protein
MGLSSPAIVVQSATGVIIGWDGAAEQTFGYGAREVLGLAIELLVQVPTKRSPQVALASPCPEELQLVCCTKDGRRLPAVCSRVSVFGSAQELLALCYVITPEPMHADPELQSASGPHALPTSREQSAISLHEAENDRARLRVILETTPGVLLTYLRDATGRMRYSFASPRARDILGFTPLQLTEDADLMVSRMHPDDMPAVRQQFLDSARTGQPFCVAYRYQHPTDGERWLEARGNPVPGDGNSFIWNGVVVDVTERKRVDEQLALIRVQLESALEAAEMGAWVLSCDDNKIWLSEGLRVVRNIPPDAPDWMDASIAMGLLHPEDSPRVQEMIEQALRTGGRIEGEVRVLGPGDTVRWVSSRGRAELHPDGRPRRLVGVDVDITKQKLAAEAALRSQKLEALGTLAGGIAHDFNNVLFAIGGNATLALDAVSPDHPAHDFLKEIVSAGERASELVRQILAFSRPAEAKREITRLHGPVNEALRLVRASMPSRVQLVSELHPSTPAVAADSARIVQLVLNLCSNAVHAIPSGRAGRIELRVMPLHIGPEHAAVAAEVSLEQGARAPVDTLCPADSRIPDGSYALLEIRDDGTGMDATTQARVFDPFFTTRPLGEGSGLGLSIVHGIMKALGGYLMVASRPRAGTTFRLYFPAMPDPPVTTATYAMPAPHGMSRRILFVDDEAMLVTLGRNVLSRLGYEPLAFQDAHDALAAFRAAPESFHGAVTDLSMPAMSGFQLARSLLELRPDLPIVMVSGYFGPEERATGRELGIRHMVDKPVSMLRLGELLSTLC